MFSTVTSLADPMHRDRPVLPSTVQPHHQNPAPSSLEEAYELRLLAEVARWDDQAAFEEIYARHFRIVNRVALSVCANPGTAEEIVQHTFTALWVRAERLVAKSVRLRPWLTTVARNAAIDHLRSERPVGSLDDAVDLASSVPSPEDIAVTRASEAEVTAALLTLSLDQRRAVELIFIAGMTFRSAAEALGEPLGTVKSRVRLAIGHLRTLLATGTR